MSCKRYEKVDSDCVCVFEYTDKCNNYSIDLKLITKTSSSPNGFNVVTSDGKSVFIPKESDFTLDDILAAKCACHASGGDGAGGVAANVTITNPTGNAQDVDGNATADTGVEVVLQGVSEVKNTAVSGKVTPRLRESSVAGSTVDNAYQISIVNIGGAAGTVDGVTFPAGVSVEYSAQYNVATSTYKLLNPLTFDSTGTLYLISETV